MWRTSVIEDNHQIIWTDVAMIWLQDFSSQWSTWQKRNERKSCFQLIWEESIHIQIADQFSCTSRSNGLLEGSHSSAKISGCYLLVRWNESSRWNYLWSSCHLWRSIEREDLSEFWSNPAVSSKRFTEFSFSFLSFVVECDDIRYRIFRSTLVVHRNSHRSIRLSFRQINFHVNFFFDNSFTSPPLCRICHIIGWLSLALLQPGRDYLLYIHCVFSSLSGIVIVITSYASSNYFSKSRAFVASLLAGAGISSTMWFSIYQVLRSSSDGKKKKFEHIFIYSRLVSTVEEFNCILWLTFG